jgi:asparagine synthase (glutamine-hydrolysing)
MCGIAGLIAGDKTEYGPTLRAMLGSIAYRGPDESGFYTDGTIGLAHARLAILDPQNGRQPAMSEDGGVVVIYNGEIYNFKALRNELEQKGHVIANNSDTAVLPHLYEEDGPEMFKKLNGQFAVAVWDKFNKKLILGRDRFGEKPLYYCRRGTDFCFASEAKAIFQSGIVKPELSPDALRHVFTFWTTVGDESVFRNIYQLPPGSFLIFENGEPTVAPYWRQTFPGPADASGKRRDAADYAGELEARFVASVMDRMIADVPVSFYISGGLDSALVACIAAKTTASGSIRFRSRLTTRISTNRNIRIS